MSLLERCYPGGAAVLMAVTVVVQITAVVLLAWLLGRLVGRRRAAWRSAIWLGALLAVLASPAASVLLRGAGISLVSVSLPERVRVEPIAEMPVRDVPHPGATSRGRSLAGEARGNATATQPSASGVPSRPSRTALRGWNYRYAAGGAVFFVWVAGSLFSIVRFVLGCRFVLGLHHCTTPLDASLHAATLANVRRTLGVARLPGIVTSPRVLGPLAVGGVGPARVILPEGFAATLDARGLHDVLVHECAHVLQRDPYVGLLQRLAEMLFWPHVLVHWLNRQLTSAREELCDNYVLRGSEATHYSRTLLRLSELALAPLPLAAAGLLRPMDNLPARVAGLLDEGRNTMTRVSTWKTALVTAAVLIPVVCVAGTRVLTAEPQADAPAPAVPDPVPAPPATQQRDEVDNELAELMRKWETEVRARMAKDERLKELSDRFPLVVLHSRALFAGGDYKRSAYSFVHETSDPERHRNNVQLLFHNGGRPNTFNVTMLTDQQHSVVDLGPVDFATDPDVKLNLDDPGFFANRPIPAVEGHVYLEWVRDSRGHRFEVLFQVVALGPESEYMAFLWRKLPRPDAEPEREQARAANEADRAQALPPEDLSKAMLVWNRQVQERLKSDEKLKKLAQRYPLVVLHSRRFARGGGYQQSAYSFIEETTDRNVHGNHVQIQFDNNRPKTVHVNMTGGQENVLVDLGTVDFQEDPDPTKFMMDDPAILPYVAKVTEGHVYLERVRDNYGNNFYVVFQVAALDPESRYLAFLWRRLPGGVVVPRGEPRRPEAF